MKVAGVLNLMNPIVGDSSETAQGYDDKSLDFVFIDADHAYENVKRDINAWLPKIKSGGILAGHDYISTHSGVKRAVDELFKDVQVRRSSWLIKNQ